MNVGKINRYIRRNILLILVVVASFLAIAAGALRSSSQPTTWKDVLPQPEHTKVDERKPLHEQTRIVELAGRTFEIPVMYFDTALDPGVKQDALLLEVIWPEMRSTYELKDKAEYDRIRKTEHRLGWILLHPSSARPPLNVQLGNMQNFVANVEYMGKSNGVERQFWYVGTPQGIKRQHEVFIEHDQSGTVISYIDCDSDERGLYPRCSHKFVDGGIMYEISYNKATFLEQWREHRNRAIGFMHKYEISNTSGDE